MSAFTQIPYAQRVYSAQNGAHTAVADSGPSGQSGGGVSTENTIAVISSVASGGIGTGVLLAKGELAQADAKDGPAIIDPSLHVIGQDTSAAGQTQQGLAGLPGGAGVAHHINVTRAQAHDVAWFAPRAANQLNDPDWKMQNLGFDVRPDQNPSNWGQPKLALEAQKGAKTVPAGNTPVAAVNGPPAWLKYIPAVMGGVGGFFVLGPVGAAGGFTGGAVVGRKLFGGK